ncbi:MAG TPA: hypothetical protein VK986_12360, partial [Tepidisphaeraceae bacterium]|nr:hypothetical protein [Tepidisphaeraceae bacterium]
ALALTASIAQSAAADPRPFTFVTDGYAVGKGSAEFEQWATWKHHKKEEPGYDRFEFREELEMGLADNFDLAIYLPNWSYEDSDSRKGTRYDGVSVEAIYYLTKPTDFVGIALYCEVSIGETCREFAFEQKLIIQKDIGPWVLAYNLIVETEVEHEGGETHVEGVLEHAFGVSYALSPKLRVGAELVVESVYEDWSHYEKTEVYAGPNVHYNIGSVFGPKTNWWVTVTPMFQLSDHDDEPDFAVRVITGIEF